MILFVIMTTILICGNLNWQTLCSCSF